MLGEKVFISKHGETIITILRGQGGLHQDFLEIAFLVVSDRGE